METQFDRMVRIRAAMVARQPFFGVLASRLRLEESRACDTAMTDGIRLWFNPDYVAGLTDSQAAGLWAHETLHCTNAHFDRLGGRDPELFNQAADYAINPLVISAGFELPEGVLIDARFAGMGAEEIYSLLSRERDQSPEPDQSQDGKGSPEQGEGSAGEDKPGEAGEGSQDQSGEPGEGSETGEAGAEPGPTGTDPGKCGGFCKPAPEPGETGEESSPGDFARELAEQWEEAARQCARVLAKDAGELPGYARDMIADLDRPRVDWRSALADFVSDRIALDYSMSRPNRRYISAGFYLPSLVPDGIAEIVLFADSSGSMNRPAWSAILAELSAMLDSGAIARLHVVQGDTRVQHVATYESGDLPSRQTYGGGRTDFRDCMAHIAEHFPHAAACIAFTDMEVSPERIGEDPGIPVLWAIWGAMRDYPEKAGRVPFGEPMALDAA